MVVLESEIFTHNDIDSGLGVVVIFLVTPNHPHRHPVIFLDDDRGVFHHLKNAKVL